LYPAAQSQERAVDGAAAATAEEGVEQMARGPVHEAFAQPSVRSPRPSPMVPKQPPDPIEEMPPDQKPEGANVVWIPGYWVWDEDRNDFIWESGVWRDVPPDRQWVPGYWNQVDDGWQWVGGYWNIQNQATVDYLPQPPDPIVESIPAQPDAQSIYIPGTWVFYQTRFLWRPGFWMPFRPGWVWTPAFYRWTPAGFVFVDGFWDFPFAERGLLFSPVFINRAFWTRPGWFYRPRYVVWDTFLLGSLFVRLDNCRYYFGNFFDAGYTRRGFIPWVDFRFGRTAPDPLFTFYRWHSGDPRWETEMRQLYTTRRENPAKRPPLTFAEIAKAPVTAPARAGSIAAIRAATPAVALSRAAPAGVKLQTVPKQQLTEIQKAAVETRNFSRARRQVEAKAVVQGQSTPKEGQPLKLELPKTGRPAVTATPGAKPKSPPPAPTIPKAEVRTPPRTTPETRPGTVTPGAPKGERKIEPKGEPKVEPKGAPKVEPKGEPKPAPKVEPKGEPKVEPKREPKVEPKPAPKVEPKVEPKPPARVEPKNEPKPPPPPRVEPKPEPKPAPPPARPEPKPAPKEEKKKDKDKG
jgi:hypothetical protein